MRKISGSARGWTEQQREMNLWEKKGQSLIAKVRFWKRSKISKRDHNFSAVPLPLWVGQHVQGHFAGEEQNVGEEQTGKLKEKRSIIVEKRSKIFLNR